MNMKLDYKRTIKVGLAFMIIMVFWEVYDFAVPLMLDRTYGLSSSIRGLIMGMDNLLAIFLLPLFGMLSDRSKGKRFGRRTPFIFLGTIIACIFVIVMVFMENFQLQTLVAQGIKDPNVLVNKGFLDAVYLAPEYINATTGSAAGLEYLDALHSAQSAMAAAYTKANPISLILFVCALFVLLVAMSTFRSPAVALMPDVTVKPLRTSANAIINFMGGVGAFLAIGIYTFLTPEYGSYVILFLILAAVMIVGLVLYLIFVKENKFVAMRYEEEKRWNIIDEEEQVGNERLSKGKLISLILILLAVFLWFMGYNAVKSHLSVYAVKVLNMKTSEVGIINFANGFGGAIALFPVALFANKLGRKKTVMIGLVIAAAALLPCAWLGYSTRWLFAVFFVLAGFGLIIINVNTLPMVVELSRGSNVGRYTGFYYVATMSAQAITPYIAGLFMDNIKENTVFIYATVCIMLSFIVILFVKHGDNKPSKDKLKEDMFSAD